MPFIIELIIGSILGYIFIYLPLRTVCQIGAKAVGFVSPITKRDASNVPVILGVLGTLAILGVTIYYDVVLFLGMADKPTVDNPNPSNDVLGRVIAIGIADFFFLGLAFCLLVLILTAISRAMKSVAVDPLAQDIAIARAKAAELVNWMEEPAEAKPVVVEPTPKKSDCKHENVEKYYLSDKEEYTLCADCGQALGKFKIPSDLGKDKPSSATSPTPNPAPPTPPPIPEPTMDFTKVLSLDVSPDKVDPTVSEGLRFLPEATRGQISHMHRVLWETNQFLSMNKLGVPANILPIWEPSQRSVDKANRLWRDILTELTELRVAKGKLIDSSYNADLVDEIVETLGKFQENVGETAELIQATLDNQEEIKQRMIEVGKEMVAFMEDPKKFK